MSSMTWSSGSVGFWWDGVWHEMRPHGDGDGPPAGVREPRRPGPSAPAGAAALELSTDGEGVAVA